MAQAESAAGAAKQALDDAERELEAKRELTADLNKAETELAVAREALRAAETAFNAVDTAGARSSEWWDAWAQREKARLTVEGAEKHLANVQRMYAEPQQLLAAVDAARARYEVAQAAVDLARAKLDLAQAGPSEFDLRLGEAAVRLAQSKLDGAGAKMDLLSVTSPISGTVIDVPAELNTRTVPGSTVVRVGDLDPVTLTIYAPETELGRLSLGQTVEVEIDADEDSTFEGEVVSIATEAEFTPKNVQTKDERTNLVFAVKIRIPNPDGRLKPGMPATATIDLGESEE